MDCRFCRWMCNWLLPPGKHGNSFGSYVAKWEGDYAIKWEPWGDSDELHQRGRASAALLKSDPRRALALSEVLAAEGHVWSMRLAGSLHAGNHGIEQNLLKAEQFYYQALLGGSWTATIELSKLLNRQQINEKWEAILENGHEVGFIPSSYWLAWYRYKRHPSRKTARSIRPMLEKAVAAAHPGARMLLCNLKSRGKFGLADMRDGFREVRVVLDQFDKLELPSSLESINEPVVVAA